MSGPSTLPTAGDTVAGKYRIETLLGRGGMSVVYGAVHRVTGRRFAIKYLLPEISANPDAARRFVREAQVSGRFQHPNVVEVFDIGEDQGSHYMVMEWLQGEALSDRISRGGPMSLEAATTLLVPCMRGVAAAHAAGIVHRDLKPANIFLCAATHERPEHAKVLDFGISKLTVSLELGSSVTHTGVVMGTPHYMSPEQMQGQPVDARMDVYAFGVILYQVFSARLPYPAKTYGELVLQIATGRPEPLESLVPGLPEAMGPIVSRAMARDPAARFANMPELIDAVERAQPGATGAQDMVRGSGRPLSSAGTTPWVVAAEPVAGTTHPPGRRRRLGLVAAVLTALAVGALLLLLRWQNNAGAPAATPTMAAQPPATVAHSLQGQPTPPQPGAPPNAAPPQPATTLQAPAPAPVAAPQPQPQSRPLPQAGTGAAEAAPSKTRKPRSTRPAAPNRARPAPAARKAQSDGGELERNPLQMHIQ